MAAREEVSIFLSEWREATGNFIDFVPRLKNRITLQELRITETEAKKCVQNLRVENYVSGPEIDIDKNTKDIWIFGLKIKGEKIYIKVKIYQYHGIIEAKCLSFHKADHTLYYPFK